MLNLLKNLWHEVRAFTQVPAESAGSRVILCRAEA